MASRRRALAGIVITAIAFLLIVIATLTPDGSSNAGAVETTCRWECAESLVSDFLLNILLFIPLGIGLRLAGVRARRAIVVSAVLSGAIELLQVWVVIGRDASIHDLLSNTLGGGLGWLLASRIREVIHPTPNRAAVLTVGALGVWLGALSLGAWGALPAPTSSAFWGERAPELGDFAVFQGDLLSAKVNGVELPAGRMPDDDAVRRELQAGRVRVEAVVRAPISGSGGLAPIVRIADERQNEILLLAQSGSDLLFKVRSRAVAMRFDAPGIALTNAFVDDAENEPPQVPPDTVTAEIDHGRVTLSVRGPHQDVEQQFALSPALGWSFFVPWSIWLSRSWSLLSALWLAVLLVPLSYWTMKASSDRRWLPIVVGAIAASAMAFIPLLFGVPAAPLLEWIAAAGGVFVGWSGATRQRR